MDDDMAIEAAGVERYVEMRMAKLAVEAFEMANAHEAWRRRENEGRSKDKSVLSVFVRSRGTTSLIITWRKASFYKDNGPRSKGPWKVISKDVNKGKGFAYPTKRLMAEAKPWEQGAVINLEAEFAKIRADVNSVKKLYMAYLHTERVRKEREKCP